ncbi:MAG: hypothetical protein WD070_04970 [Pirellulaceae bacterium]
MGTLAHIVAESNDVDRAKQILKDTEQIPHKEQAAEYLTALKAQFKGQIKTA